MIDLFKHLLPRAKAWCLTSEKQLRQFFSGLTGIIDDIKQFTDDTWLDIFPATTRNIEGWENQLGLPSSDLTEQQKRNRLDGRWKALGGQSPRYIQDTLQNAGFNVYVHEWWSPASEPLPGDDTCVIPRNPFLVLASTQEDRRLLITCNNPIATCGNPAATAGSSSDPIGYPLVNKIYVTVKNLTPTCGNPAVTCGNPDATAGQYNGFKQVFKEYFIPTDTNKWNYFLYIGGINFGDIASLPISRKNEFEDLCLQICPTQLWLGIIVEYN